MPFLNGKKVTMEEWQAQFSTTYPLTGEYLDGYVGGTATDEEDEEPEEEAPEAPVKDKRAALAAIMVATGAEVVESPPVHESELDTGEEPEEE